MENRFQFTKKFLSEVQDQVGMSSTVSLSYGPQGYSMIVSFHENEEIDEDEVLHVEFDDSDFQDDRVYEESIIEQIEDYVDENIQKT